MIGYGMGLSAITPVPYRLIHSSHPLCPLPMAHLMPLENVIGSYGMWTASSLRPSANKHWSNDETIWPPFSYFTFTFHFKNGAMLSVTINTSTQNGCHVTNTIFTFVLLSGNCFCFWSNSILIWLKINSITFCTFFSMKNVVFIQIYFFPNGPINNKLELV